MQEVLEVAQDSSSNAPQNDNTNDAKGYKVQTINYEDPAIEARLKKTREQLSLPPKGSTIAVSNLSVYVKASDPKDSKPPRLKDAIKFTSGKKKVFTILDELSFYLLPGMMTLMIGGPGSGKTSIFKALAHRLKGVRVSGDIMFNGHLPDRRTHHRDCTFVTQSDIHSPLLTVRETIKFSAHCQMPETASEELKDQAVDDTLAILGLSHRADTYVGNEFLRGISGGEKRRLSIGVEFVKGPNALLLDEPTTGLDASAALDVLRHLRLIANTGIPVLTSLLQPSYEILQLFTHVMMVDKGKLLYFGPLDEVIPYFEERGFFCPTTMNPADFLGELMNDPTKYCENPTLKNTDDFVESYKSSPIFHSTELTLNKLKKNESLRTLPTPTENAITKAESQVTLFHRNPSLTTDFDNAEEVEDWVGSPQYPLSTWQQFKAVMKRSILQTIRDTATLQARIGNALIMALVIGTIFLRLDNDQEGSSTAFGLIFLVCGVRAFATLAEIPVLINQRKVFYEQKSAGYYNTFAYYYATALSDIPLSIFEVLLFSCIVYWLAGLNSDPGRFFFFVLMLFVLNQTAIWFFRCVSIASKDFEVANGIGPGLLAIQILFSGFMIQEAAMPRPWAWVYWLSIFRYSFGGLSLNQFIGTKAYCKESQLLPPTSDPKFDLPYPEGYNRSQTCAMTSGEDVLRSIQLDTDPDLKWWLLLGMIGWALFYFIVGWLALTFLEYHEQKIPPREETEEKEKEMNNNDLELKIGGEQEEYCTGTYVTFKDLSYFVTTGKNEELQLLKSITGYFKPGMLVALMGASGAGKTTLLDVLADRKTGGRITGELLFNGKPRDQFFKRIAAYVEQTDAHLPTQTVREALQFSANLRLSADIPLADRMKFVEDALTILDLQPIAHLMIGEGNNGLSGEQKKRVTIGVQLAANASLIFLDEPTSGLDSAAADKVMKVVKKIAEQGRTVVCTIHQPSSKIFSYFTDLLLLKKGGEQVYFGPIGQDQQQLFAYFQQFGIHCPPFKNPADWILEVTGGGIENSRKQEGIKEPAEAYRKSSTFQQVQQDMSAGIVDSSVKFETFDRIYACSFVTQLKEVIKRGAKVYVRRPDVIQMRILRALIVGLLLGTLYFQMSADQTGGRLRIACLMFAVIYANMSALGIIPVVFEERNLFYRERAAGTYSSFVYMINLALREIPFTLISVAFFSMPAYWIAGLNSAAGRVWYFIGMFFLLCSAFNSINQFLSVISPNIMIANLLAGTGTSFFFLLAGFVIFRPSIPPWWIWLYWFNPIRYPLEGLTVNEVQDVPYYCTDSQYLKVPVSDENGTIWDVNYCVTTNGNQFLDIFGMYPAMKWPDFFITLGVFVCFLLATTLALKFVIHSNR